MRKLPSFGVVLVSILLCSLVKLQANPRPANTLSFDKDWRFHLGDVTNGQDPQLDDSQWRTLDLPHDWSIEGEFSERNPATPGGGALPGGIGWYRKTFNVPDNAKSKKVLVDFD